MLFDTDILIWCDRGNRKAAGMINDTDERFISVQSYMEFVQGAKSQDETRLIKEFLTSLDIRIMPFTENVGHRASIYIEEYALSSGLRAGDAIIAATAVENNLTLATSNHRHFRPIRDLKIRSFSP